MKPWLKENDVKSYSAHNQEKFIVAKRVIRTLKNKIYKYMTLISKNMSINKLDNIPDKYNDKYHRTINPNQRRFLDIK